MTNNPLLSDAVVEAAAKRLARNMYPEDKWNDFPHETEEGWDKEAFRVLARGVLEMGAREISQPLLNLLAIIHCDDGSYTETVGIEQAIKDAHKVWGSLIQASNKLKALTAAGYAVLPVEPTLDMIVAGTEDWMKIRATEDRAEAIWKAMLSAAQTGEEG